MFSVSALDWYVPERYFLTSTLFAICKLLDSELLLISKLAHPGFEFASVLLVSLCTCLFHHEQQVEAKQNISLSGLNFS